LLAGWFDYRKVVDIFCKIFETVNNGLDTWRYVNPDTRRIAENNAEICGSSEI